MNKQTIFSGIQPSGKLHIGNYLGALSNFVKLQNEGKYNCFYSIVDLHSISEDYDPKEKQNLITDLAASFLAAGIDPNKSTLFIQSQVPEHTELAWIFNCITPLGEVERMTQFKDKSQRQAKNINMGLLAYPILQAADILLYHTNLVPVGTDQKQHLELTNSISKKFNNRFGITFKEIEPMWTKFPKVMDLKKPDKKMSKSEPSGCLFLDDTPEEIEKKVKSAVTASEPGKKSPGEENLFTLLEYFGKPEQVKYFKEKQEFGNLKYSELKETLGQSIAEYFSEFRQRKQKILAKPDYLAEVLADGAARARKVAKETILEVKEKIGLL